MAGLIHETAVEKILQQDETLKTKGFSSSVKKIVSEELLDDDYFIDSLRIIPDAYKIEDGGHYETCKTVTIIEIEDSSKISNSKMEKIIDIWSALDNDSHILKLQTYDRYGNFISDVSICDYYYKILKENRK